MKKSIAALAVAAALFGGAVANVHAQALDDPIPAAITQDGALTIQLVTVADGLVAPNWGTSAPGVDHTLFVADQPGVVWAIDLKKQTKRVFADVSARLVPLGAFGPGTFDERGLIGMAFHPKYKNNGKFYTFTSEPAGTADFPMAAGVAVNCLSTITEWTVANPRSDSASVDPASARVLMTIAKPQFNHNGGALVFDKDGLLYIAVGDGGAADDQGAGHSPRGNGQDTSNLLGKILRIDPLGNNAPNGKYGIPKGNPFVPSSGSVGGAQGCADGKCDEIYSYGWRNPFRMSFDSKRGTLIAADVGQNDIEEVSIVKAGGNYGWPVKEGSFFFNNNGAGRGFVQAGPVDGVTVPPDLIGPVAEYDHDEGISVIGGFVYRGEDFHDLRGQYVFGDYSRAFASAQGRLFHMTAPRVKNRGKDGVEIEGANPTIREFIIRDRATLGLYVLGFGEDSDGEIYLMANARGVPAGTTGVVLKIAPVKADNDDDEDDGDGKDD